MSSTSHRRLFSCGLRRRLSAALAMIAMGGTALAGSGYDEAVSGDLSTNPLAPTALSFSPGDNVVTGTVTSGAPSDTRDYFTFTVPAGSQLTGIFLNDWRDFTSGANGNRGFMHIDNGSTSVVPGFDTMLDFLGGTHVDRSVAPTAATNLLNLMAAASAGGTGFTAPLPAGAYTINIQQAGPQRIRYTVTIALSQPALPCPADLNGDDFVDDTDFVEFASAYENFVCPGTPCPADFNDDGFVDDSDFVTFAAAYEAFTCP